MNRLESHRAVDVGRGLAALVGVVALVAGVPALLAVWVGWPLPRVVPAVSEVTSALRDTYIPDEFLVKALAVVCWLVWVELVASLLVEAVAYARGRKAGAVPLAGGLQKGAARLVAMVALLGAVVATRGVPESGSRSSDALLPVTEPVVALVIDDEGMVVAPPGVVAGAPVAEPEVAVPVYEVQRRDTLWDIAERHLGDPLRWQEIFRLNEGCPQADGRCLVDPDLIYAGWQLSLPADAVGLAPPAAPAPVPAPVPGPGEGSGEVGVSPPGGSPVIVDEGMVLIDDGATDAVGDAVLVSDITPVPPATHSFDGMVLLPDPGAGLPAADEIASRAEGAHGASLRPAPND